MNLSTLVRRLSLFILCIAGAVSAEQKFRWTFSENQLDIDRGGRVNSIAVNPDNRSEMFVASETGGLFVSTNGGRQWTHVNSLPVIFTQDVIYLPWDSNTLLVTAKADFKTNNGGGLWRSLNRGQSWHRVGLNVPNFTGRLSAYGISAVDGNRKLVVGTSEGIFFSTDSAAGAWTYSNVFGTGNKTVYSVLVENSVPPRINAGGPAGVRRATLPITSWQAPLTPPGTAGIFDIHAFAKAPLAASHVQSFVVNGATELYRTGDGGVNWRRIPAAPPGGPGCGGAAFVRVIFQSINATNFLHVYFGNRCGLHRLEARIDSSGNANYDGSWLAATQLDGNPRDLGLYRDEPVLLGSNFGLHQTVTGIWRGLIWNLAGNGKRGGFNALQVTEVDGQIVGTGANRATHLYVATQDNNLWAAHTLGNPWASYAGSTFFVELERAVDADSQTGVTFVPGNYGAKLAGDQLEWIADWNNPPAAAGKPAFVRRGQWVQQVRTEGNMVDGLATTENSGASWRQFATYPDEPRDIPKLGRSGSVLPRRASILYQAYRANGLSGGDPRRNLLMRISRHLDSPQADVTYPDMIGFGGLGINPTMFAWYQVFGVDPGDPDHIIAPDVVQQQVMETRTGGDIWTLVDLKSKVTAGTALGGPLNFRTDLSGGRTGEVFPIVTAVSFCPDDPQLVVVGTSEGGIFFSKDNGASWDPLAGTELATYITSFFWQNTNTIFVSTYGRGLWKLENRRIVAAPVGDLCGSCDMIAVDSTPNPQFTGSVLTFGGNILGVRTDKGLVREVFVTPGSSVLFTGDPGDMQDDILITESDGRDTSQYASMPKPPRDGWLLTGVVFEKDDSLVGGVFAESEMTLVPPQPEAERKGSTVSPTTGKPYIRLVSASFNGVATAAPEEMLPLNGTGFAAGMKYELLVDGEALKGDVTTADGSGAFSTRVPAPAEPGYHRVEVRVSGSEELLDATELVVK